MDDDLTFCRIEFTKDNLNYVKGWNGFISPDGKFYKVAEREANVSAHDYFVEMFTKIILNIDIEKKYEEIKTNNPYVKANISYKDMFIHVLGYVNYEHIHKNNVDIGCPNPQINGRKITKEQVEMLLHLMSLNKDEKNDIYQIFDYDRKNNFIAESTEYRHK